MESDPSSRAQVNADNLISSSCTTEPIQLKESTHSAPVAPSDESIDVQAVHAEAEAEFVAIEIQTVGGVANADATKGVFGKAEGNGSPRFSASPSQSDKLICRVCHLSLSDSESDLEEDGVASSSTRNEVIELGCECKDDLAHAHRRCAETWFKIKGNRTCEICGKLVQNVAPGMVEDAGSCGRRSDDQSEFLFNLDHPGGEERSFWHHRPICNFVLAFIVIILLLPWLFRVRLF